MDFDSLFSYDGSVSLTTDVASDLEVVLDVWAADPKRTREWTPNNEKVFGFAINAYDRRVDDKAVLTQKRRVYISSISITSQTAQTSGMVQQPFQFAERFDDRADRPPELLRKHDRLDVFVVLEPIADDRCRRQILGSHVDRAMAVCCAVCKDLLGS